MVQSLTLFSCAALWLRDGKIKAADARLNHSVLDVSDMALRLVAKAPLNESAVMARASAHRLYVAAARMIVEAQQADLSIEERSRLEDLEIGADFERDADGAKTIGLVIEVGIPIFHANQAQIAKAGSLARAAIANYEAISQHATREVRVACVNLDSASRLADQYRQTVLVIAEQNVALSQSALKSGQVDVTVVLDAQRELIDARQTLSALERDVALAWIALEQAAGGTLNLVPTQLPVQ